MKEKEKHCIDLQILDLTPHVAQTQLSTCQQDSLFATVAYTLDHKIKQLSFPYKS